MTAQIDLFPDVPAPPVEGLGLLADAISPAEEEVLIAQIDAAPLEPFRFGQWTGKRLTAYYGSGYDFQRGRTAPAPPLPHWLLGLRAKLAPQLDLSPEALQQALLIRYDPGAGIGWHRDRPQYDKVVGLSLGAPATLRLRRRRGQDGFDRHGVSLAPRAAYLLSGEVREKWEHSITPMDAPRWSITFRSFRQTR